MAFFCLKEKHHISNIHCERHNGPKALSLKTLLSSLSQSTSEVQNSTWFCLVKCKRQIHGTTLTNPSKTLTIQCYNCPPHEIIKKQYQEFSGYQYYGTYSSISGKPILTIRDLDLVQHILSKVANSRIFIMLL